MIRQKFFAVSSMVVCAALALSLAAAPAKGKADTVKGNAAKGKEVFEQCAICHNVDNDEKKVGPSLHGLYKRKTMTNGKPVNDANVTAKINEGGGGMPAYSDMLSAEDKANVLAYLHTL